MKITPIEIRQKTFEKVFRGYEKEEVDAFLVSLSQEWERVAGEVQNLKQRLAQSEADVQKLREVESSLYRTLKTAEDTGANMVEQANRSAELQMREAQMQAEALLSDAKNHARDLIDDAEMRAREISEELKDEVKRLEHEYKTLENHREDLILEMKGLAKGTLERLDNYKFKKVDFAAIMKSTHSEFESKVSKEPLLGEEAPSPIEKEEPAQSVEWEITAKKEIDEEPPFADDATDVVEKKEEESKPKGGSFFDTLD